MERSTRIELSEHFLAPCERVFQAWIDPADVRRFLFVNAGSTVTEARLDARVGGAFQITTRSEREYVNHIGIYHQITRPRSLSFSLSVPRYSLQWSRVRIELFPAPGGCTLNLFHTELFRSDLENARADWIEMLVRLKDAISPGRLMKTHP